VTIEAQGDEEISERRLPKHDSSTRRRATATTRLAYSRAEAADALGVSVDFFDEHIAHEVRAVRRGRRRLYPVRELERWLEEAASLALEDR
jgi:excisionase family DNA binding protein